MHFLHNDSLAINSSRKFKCGVVTVTKPFVVCILLSALASWSIADAWEQCLPEDGEGFCPTGNTCCPTGISGLSSCIPGRERDPEGARGQCCDLNGRTGCPYGYDCATKGDEQLCKRREPHTDDLNAEETPRYELCRLLPSESPETYELQKFPIDGFHAVYYSSMGSILPPDDSANGMKKFDSVETIIVIVHGSGRNADDYLCAGISTAAAISKPNETVNEKVLVIAPKFIADIDHEDRNRYDNTLYWLERGSNVPLGHTWRYGADAANTYSADTANGNGNPGNRIQDDENDDNYKKNQTGISSYAVMDRLLEFLIGSKKEQNETRPLRRPLAEEFCFPRLKRIVVAGHSAGGQYVHRWSLLSSSPVIWGDGNDSVHNHDRITKNKPVTANDRNIELRMVVANPRSYCYPDNRRMIRTENGLASESKRFRCDPIGSKARAKNDQAAHFNSYSDMGMNEQYSYRYAVPDPHDIDTCPTYDQWQWGLEPGGDILSPYKDAGLALLDNNTTELALRYSKRKVFYLAGEHDTIQQKDRCETYNFQGDNRNERARRYFRGLTEYLTTLGANQTRSSSINVSTNSKGTNLIHEFHQVPGSPHDHTLMFQSTPGREAFYGTGHENSLNHNNRDYNNEDSRIASS